MHRRMTAVAAALAGIWMLAGCVTINIYFPAAAAEQAADRIIDEILDFRKGDDADRGDAPAVPQ